MRQRGSVCVCVCVQLSVRVCLHSCYTRVLQTDKHPRAPWGTVTSCELGVSAGRNSRAERGGGGGTQKRCLAGHSSMVGFLHVQFVYLNSFYFNYEGIPFNIWWLLVLPMLVLVMVLLLLLLSQRVVPCPSPLLSCTVLLQLLNVARHARSLSRCRWQHDISTSPSLAPLPLRPWHITCILFRFHFVWQVNILTINWIRVFINCCVLHFIHTHTHTHVCGM